MIISSSIFTQLLSLIPRHKFRRAVSAHEGERAAKGFSCWDQLVGMLFCHLASAGSLREIVLLTNHREFGATTIAQLYKDRWQIELFFKALKQNLKLKTFVGTSRNAVHIQIWTALITMLLLKMLQFRSKLGWSLSHLAAMVRMNLMIYRDLWVWLDDPYANNATGPPDDDLPLFANYLG